MAGRIPATELVEMEAQRAPFGLGEGGHAAVMGDAVDRVGPDRGMDFALVVRDGYELPASARTAGAGTHTRGLQAATTA